jgi:hypothetical protein
MTEAEHSAYLRGATEMREKAAEVARNPYSDAVDARGGDEPFAVGAKIAKAIRALPLPSGKGE